MFLSNLQFILEEIELNGVIAYGMTKSSEFIFLKLKMSKFKWDISNWKISLDIANPLTPTNFYWLILKKKKW